MTKRTHVPVGIIMGSNSDWPVMCPAAELLTEFGVGCEVAVLSAHRNPAALAKYARSAEKRGIKVIIAGAGLSAALPGVAASNTLLPVIGVPISGRELNGLDALLAMAQMPTGVPVATVAIGNARNAALLAVRILALNDHGLTKKLAAHRKEMTRPASPRRIHTS